ncbi:E3 ubiquitin-protein ligase TOM1-like [Smittium mucronatum]|uniref:HECT-type E3 ubiquitin transferase n=1 Tax=Smittium mucronatum TaxID=133383 RepID=A0A1R0GYG1_9FUNG|nr:E3 ubiquitin-protein ligase TOM1-like [Smittium mucronatum]
MAKIKKQIRRKFIFPPSEIYDLRSKLEIIEEDKIHEIVSQIKYWPFLRSDFYYWIKVLDRFDGILGTIIDKYSLVKPEAQFSKNTLPTHTIQLLCSILDFTRLLMENCVNRTIYSSMERLEALLSVSNNLVLEKLLRLLLQISQSGSFQQDVKTSIHGLHPVLEILSQPWLNQKNLDQMFDRRSKGNGGNQLSLNELKLIFQKPQICKQSKKSINIDFNFYRSASDVLKFPKSIYDETTDFSINLDQDTTLPTPECNKNVFETPKISRNLLPSSSRKKNSGRSSSLRKISNKFGLNFNSESSFFTEGLVSIEVPLKNFKNLSSIQIFEILVGFYKVPPQKQFALFQRIRISLALSSPSYSDLNSLFKARLYATAIIALSSNKEEFKSLILNSHDKISQDLVEILKPEFGIPMDIQTASVYVLDSLLEQPAEVSSIYNALNVSANHGVIMYILRRIFTSSELKSDPEAFYSRNFRNAVYNLIITLTENFKGVRLLASSGIVSVLVDALEFSGSKYNWDVFKSTRILNLLLSAKISTFNSFCDANGVLLLTNRINSEVSDLIGLEDNLSPGDFSIYNQPPTLIPSYPSNYENQFTRPELIPSDRIVLLRELFKTLSRLMLSNGNQDRLRNLVEGSLPDSLIKVFSHQICFGSNIYGYAIDIMANMVHNEPTSLGVLQEVGLPQAFLNSISNKIPNHGDVVVAIPNGIGALCLNDAGTEMLRKSDLINKLFQVFTDVNFIKVLSETDVPSSLGVAIDEFMRHFPNLRDQVSDSIISALKDLNYLGRNISPLQKINPGNTKLFTDDDSIDKKESIYDLYTIMVESISVFLESLLEERSHNDIFIEKNGLKTLLSCIVSESISFNWVSPKTIRSINGIVRSISRSKSEEAFRCLFDEFEHLISSKSFEITLNSLESGIDYFIDPSQLEECRISDLNSSLHLIVSISGISSLITDFLNNSNSSVNRQNPILHHILCLPQNRGLIERLTKLYELILHTELYATDLLDQNEKNISDSINQSSSNLEISSNPKEKVSLSHKEIKYKKKFQQSNINYLKDILIKSSSNFSKFFQSFTKLLVPKKSTNIETSKNIFETSKIISNFLVRNLTKPLSSNHSSLNLKYIKSIVEMSSALLIKYNVRALVQVPFLTTFVFEGGIKAISNVIVHLVEFGLEYGRLDDIDLINVNKNNNGSAMESLTIKKHDVYSQCNGVLESLFTLVKFLSSGSIIFDYPYLSAIRVFAEPDSKCLYIDSENFIIPQILILHIRNTICPAIQSSWESSNITSYSPEVLESLVGCIKTLILGENDSGKKSPVPSDPTQLTRSHNRLHIHRVEEPPLSDFYNTLLRVRSHGHRGLQFNSLEDDVYDREDLFHEDSEDESSVNPQETGTVRTGRNITDTSQSRGPRTVVPNPSHVDSLLSMGFPVDSVNNALIRTFNSLDRAADYLVSHMEDNFPLQNHQSIPTTSASNPTISSIVSNNENTNSSSDLIPEVDREISTVRLTPVDNMDPAQPSLLTENQNSNSNLLREPISEDLILYPSDSNQNDSYDNGDVSNSFNLAVDITSHNIHLSNDNSSKNTSELPISSDIPNSNSDSNGIKLLQEGMDFNKKKLIESIPPRVVKILKITNKFRFQTLNAMSIFFKNKSHGKENCLENVLEGFVSPLIDISLNLSKAIPLDISSQERILSFSTFWAFVMNDPILSEDLFDYLGYVYKCILSILSVSAKSVILNVTNHQINLKNEGHIHSQFIPNWFSPCVLFICLYFKVSYEKMFLKSGDISSEITVDQVVDLNPNQSSFHTNIYPNNFDEHKPGFISHLTEEKLRISNLPLKNPILGCTVSILDLSFDLINILNSDPTIVPHDVKNSILRLVLQLSKIRSFSSALMERNSLLVLLRVLKQLPENDIKSINSQDLSDEAIEKSLRSSSVNRITLLQIKQERMLVTHIIRHVIETNSILRGLISSRVLSWFDESQFRSPEISSYLRGNSGAVLRDPNIFDSITVKHCCFLNPDSSKLSWRFLSPLTMEDVLQAESKDNNSQIIISQNKSTSSSADDKEFNFINNPNSSATRSNTEISNKKENSLSRYLDSEFKPIKTKYMDHTEIPSYESIKISKEVISIVVNEILSLRDGLHSSKPSSQSSSNNSSYADAFHVMFPGMLKHLNFRDSELCFESSEITAYRCYLLQLLYELLTICPFAVKSLIIFPNSNEVELVSTDAGIKSGSAKPRSPFISHLIHDLIVRETSLNTTLLTMAKANYKQFLEVNAVQNNKPNPEIHQTDKNLSPTHENKYLKDSNTTDSNIQKNSGISQKNLYLAQRLLYVSRSQLCLSQIYWAKTLLCLLCPPNILNPISLLSNSSELLKKTSKKTEQISNLFESQRFYSMKEYENEHEKSELTKDTISNKNFNHDIDDKASLTQFNSDYELSVESCRRIILDHICRAFKETLTSQGSIDTVGASFTNPVNYHNKPYSTQSSVSIEVTYSRLKSLSNLLNRLLNSKPKCNLHDLNDVNHKCIFTPESSNKIGIMLLERGMFDLLNYALTSLDLNYTESKSIFNALLKPMSELSNISANLNDDDKNSLKLIDKSENASGVLPRFHQNYDILNVDGNLFDVRDEDIPPDLYQNSALGLFHGDLQRSSTALRGDNVDGASASDDGFYSDQFDEDSSMSDFSESESEISNDDSSLSLSRNERYPYVSGAVGLNPQVSGDNGDVNQNNSNEWVDIPLRMSDENDISSDEMSEDDEGMVIEEIEEVIESDSFISDADEVLDSEDEDSENHDDPIEDFESDLEYDGEIVLDVLENLEDDLNFDIDSPYSDRYDFNSNELNISNYGRESSFHHNNLASSNTSPEDLVSEPLAQGNLQSSVSTSSILDHTISIPSNSQLPTRISTSNSNVNNSGLNFDGLNLEDIHQHTEGDGPSLAGTNIHPSNNLAIDLSHSTDISTNYVSESHFNGNSLSHSFAESNNSLGQSELNISHSNGINNHSIAPSSTSGQIITFESQLPGSPGPSLNHERSIPVSTNSRVGTFEIFNDLISNSSRPTDYITSRSTSSGRRNPDSRSLFRNQHLSPEWESESEFDEDIGGEDGIDMQDMVEDYPSGSDYSDSVVDFTDDHPVSTRRNNIFSRGGNSSSLNNLESSLMEIINVFVSGQAPQNRRQGIPHNNIFNNVNDLSHPLFDRTSISDSSNASTNGICHSGLTSMVSSNSNHRINYFDNLQPAASPVSSTSTNINIPNPFTSGGFVSLQTHSSNLMSSTERLDISYQDSLLSNSNNIPHNVDLNCTTLLPVNELNSIESSSNSITNDSQAQISANNSQNIRLTIDVHDTQLSPFQDSNNNLENSYVTSSINKNIASHGNNPKPFANQNNKVDKSSLKDSLYELKKKLYSTVLASSAINVNSVMNFYDRWQQESRIWYDRYVNENALKYDQSLKLKLSNDAQLQLDYRNRLSVSRDKNLIKAKNVTPKESKEGSSDISLPVNVLPSSNSIYSNPQFSLDLPVDSIIPENVHEGTFDTQMNDLNCTDTHQSATSTSENPINVDNITPDDHLNLQDSISQDLISSENVSCESNLNSTTYEPTLEPSIDAINNQNLGGSSNSNNSITNTDISSDGLINPQSSPDNAPITSSNIPESQNDQPDPTPVSESSQIQPVMVQIDGRMVDVTNLGIDLEFLNAIPNDMRRDVILQRMSELEVTEHTSSIQNPVLSNEEDEPDSVNREFLDALPIEIRHEVLEQQRLLHRLNERRRFINTPSTSNAEYSENNAILHPPPLTAQNVTQPITGNRNQDFHEDVAIPEPLDHTISVNNPNQVSTSGIVSIQQDSDRPKNNYQPKKIKNPIRLLTPAEISYLTKLIFLPKGRISEKLLGQVIFNLCENIGSRSDFINIILKVLSQDCSSLKKVEDIITNHFPGIGSNKEDLVTPQKIRGTNVEGTPSCQKNGFISLTFNELSNHHNNQESPNSIESLFSNQYGIAVSNFPLSRLNIDVTPYFPAICCLEALLKLTRHSSEASLSFLVESSSLIDSFSDSKSHSNINRLSSFSSQLNSENIDASDEIFSGKNNDDFKSNSQLYVPSPLVLLLRLLGIPLFCGSNSTVTELLMQLLATVTKPLSAYVRRKILVARLTGIDTPPYSTSQDNTSGIEASNIPLNHLSTDRTDFSTSIRRRNNLQNEKFRPPTIPNQELSMISNVLVSGECTSKTFQYTLTLIQHLLNLDGTLFVIMDSLNRSAIKLAEDLCKDLQCLIDLLENLVVPSSRIIGSDFSKIEDNDHLLEQKTSANQNSEDKVRSDDDWVSSKFMDELQTLTSNKFSSASSHQSKILRILKAFDYILTHTTKKMDQGNIYYVKGKNSEAIEDQIKHIHDLELEVWNSKHFIKLWDLLSLCLTYSQKSVHLNHLSTVLLPIIEAFMVVSKPFVTPSLKSGLKTYNEAKKDPSPLDSGGLDISNPSFNDSFFVNFTDGHKKILNSLVRDTPGLLSGSFSLLVHNPRVLDFDNKRSYVYQELSRIISNSSRSFGRPLNLNVRRQYVFEDSFHQFAGKSGKEIRGGKLNVKFHDEEGVDVGGVTREWFQVLSRQMFNPDYALFLPSASDRITYQPNPQSWANPDHLLYFKFVGRVIGKAICDQRLMDAYFTRSFYKHILGKPVDYKDLEALDPEYFKSLQWILENDITDIVYETFSVEVDDFGQHRIVELIPNGSTIQVNEENKAEYVRLVAEQRLSLAIKDQIQAFLNGFHELVPKDLIQIMNEQEIELLISGMPDIDVDDWRNNTEYNGGYSPSSPQIIWFWRTVRSFDQEERAKLLQFVTGTSKVPLEGFSKLQGSGGIQKFQIHRDFSSTARLPSAHTCFNQLDLPLYDSYEILRSQLLLAVNECNTGFGFS